MPEQGVSLRWMPAWYHVGLGEQTMLEMNLAQHHNAQAGYSIPETPPEMIPDTQRALVVTPGHH